MDVLMWLSVVLLVTFLAVFLFWSFREERARPAWVSRWFWCGVSIFAALFVVFTVQSLSVMPARTHQEKLTPEVVAGKLVWQKDVCVDCHTILGNGAYYGPDLTKAWDRFRERAGGDDAGARAALIAFLKNPPAATSDRRGMTNYHMTDQEARQLASFLEWTSHIDTNGWPPKPLRPIGAAPPVQTAAAMLPPLAIHGQDLVQKDGCEGCHGVSGVAPDLHGVAAKWSRADLVRWLEDTNTIYRERKRKPLNAGFSEMPSMNASPDDAKAMAAYLLSLGGKESEQ